MTTPTAPFDFGPATCPLPGCDSELHLTYTLDRALYAGDFDEPFDAVAFLPADAHYAHWTIGCANGHVVAVPGAHIGCPCDDPGGDDCVHNENDFDCSEDQRSFRAGDWAALRELLAAGRA